MNELFLQLKKIITLILLLFLIGITTASVTADFSTDITYSATVPSSVQFTDASVCTPACTSWAWDFNGDGVIDSVLQNPGVYIFTYSGNFSPRLMVSNDLNTGGKTKIHYITIAPLIPAPVPVPSSTWGASAYHDNITSYSYKMDTSVDLQNSTYLRLWLKNFTTTKKFSTSDFAASLIAPIMSVFGFWIFLIIWCLYLLAVWIRTGDTTLPLIIGILTIGIFGLLFPVEAMPVIIIIMAICGAIILTKLLKDQV
jgi:hypothetical protein